MTLRKIKMRFHNRWGSTPHWHAEIYCWKGSPYTFIPYAFPQLTRHEDLAEAIQLTLANIRRNPLFTGALAYRIREKLL